MKRAQNIFLAFFALFLMAQEAKATVYRPGFQQFRYSCAKDKEADLTVTYDSITDANKRDITATTLMASINGTGNIVNPLTGKTWNWSDNTTFGYESQIWLEPGTYTFWGRYDDGGAVVINSDVIYTHGAKSGYNESPVAGDFVVTKAGWYDFRGYVWDWAGGKCPMGEAKSAIQMKKDGGDWIINMEGVPARYATDVEYLEIQKAVASETEGCFDVTVAATFPSGTTAQVWALATNGNVGHLPKDKWSSSSEAQSITSDGTTQILTLTVDVSALENPYVVAYSESVYTDILTEESAANPDFNLEKAYSSLAPVATAAAGYITIDEVKYSDVDIFTNIDSFGEGATGVEGTIEVSTSVDFSNPITVELGSLAFGASLHTISGLTTNVTYNIRLVMVNSEGATTYTDPVEFTTLNPQPAVVSSTLYTTEYNVFKPTVILESYGAGSTTATVSYQVSTTEDFSDIVIDQEVPNAMLGQGVEIKINKLDDGSPLVGASTYYFRPVVVNEWGLVTYGDTIKAQLADTIITYNGFGYNKTDAGLELVAYVTYVLEDAIFDATLEINDVVVKEWNGINAATTLTYTIENDSLKSKNTAKLTFDITTNNGQTVEVLEEEFIKNQQRVMAFSSIAELDNNDASYTIAKIGDVIKMPKLIDDNENYVAGDTRVARLLEDGNSIEIIGHGFTKITKRIVDPASGNITLERGLVVVPPTPAGEGNVYMLIIPQADRYWDTTHWKNLTNPEAGGYPSKKDDIAMIFMYGTKSLFVNTDITVGQIWFGGEGGNFYLRGQQGGEGAKTVTFERSDKEMPLFRISGLEQTDGVVLPWALPKFYIQPSLKTPLIFDCSNDLLFDAGCPFDPSSREDVAGKSLQRVSLETGFILNIPKGAKAVFDGTNAGNRDGDDQRGNATFCFGSNAFVGEGIVDYNGPSNVLFTPDASEFNGLFDLTNMNKYDCFGVGNRGGGIYMLFWDGNQPGANASQRLEGHIGLGSSSNVYTWDDSFGIINCGSAHGYGSYGPVPNHFAPKAFYSRGGGININNQNNGDWAAKGILDSIYASEQLVLEDGLLYANSEPTDAANYPTNSLLFAEVSNLDGKGVFAVNFLHIRASSDQSTVVDGISKYKGRVQIGNFQDIAIGEGSSENAKIVPWIVNAIGGSQLWYFAKADEDGFLLPAGYPSTENLRNFAATANAYCVNGNSLNLLQDKTVNSLVLKGLTGDRSTLGEGMTATITSGGLIFTSDISHIDSEEVYNAGTRGNLVFPNRAFIFAGIKSTTSPSEIWANISAPKGMTITYPGTLLLGGDQTGIDKEIHISNSNLILGKNTTPAVIDVPISMHSGGSSLTIANEGSLCKQEIVCTTATRQFPKINVAFEGTENCQKLTIDGETLPRGTYGATDSGAEFINDRIFTGVGILKVLSDDLLQPTILLLK